MKFTSAAHHPVMTARLGKLLALTFGICLATGLFSHAIQHPPDWFGWPSRPVWLYRLTQGAHVLSGIATVPLLLAKVWTVYPKLFTKPALRSLRGLLDRCATALLVGCAGFQLVTGLLNIARHYPWTFFFPEAHSAVAWLTGGALVLHVAIRLPLPRAERTRTEPGERHRRAFLRTTLLATGAALAATAGATVTPLRGLSPLSWRPPPDRQGIPVNRTAAAAGVRETASTPSFRLRVTGRHTERLLEYRELVAMPQHTVTLPIACVEGWSASAEWTGVRIRDLLALIGIRGPTAVHVVSLEQNGIYARSVLPAPHVADELTLLALRLNGAPLDLDHGYPCRVIAPNQPGVLQTKWVRELRVIDG